ncbi:unnamed protein product [Rotaria sordida]|uniref:Cadherin domain-containing protein n=2 Tax=Rotaria sordida TaxID=392033 RepID=A0A815BIW5_9BILA|nr:unnamed protein product [Rotaria sordida]
MFAGDPLGLFTIDSNNQSLIFLDESLARSYIYPLTLTIIDISQNELINSTVTIFISNIGIHFPCPSYLKSSPYIFTYESLSSNILDPLTNHEYKSLIIRAFDPFTPINGEASNQAECIINNEIEYRNNLQIENLNFIFENEFLNGYINDTFGLSSYIYNSKQEPIEIKIKKDFSDIKYYLLNAINKKIFQSDEYAGLIKYNSFNKFQYKKYSLIIYAKYQTLITFIRLNILINYKNFNKKISLQSIYEFKLYTPFVNNYTIGYINTKNQNFIILNENILPIISIDQTGRLFIKNRTLLLINENFYDFLIQNEDLEIIRIQIFILAQRQYTYECILNYLNNINDKQLIGFIDILNNNNNNETESLWYEKSYYLLNYNNLFLLDRQHGLLYYKDQNQTINDDLLLLIQIDNSRCLITVEKHFLQPSYLMIRNGSSLHIEMKEQYHIEKSSGQIKLHNNTIINYNIIPSQSPIFSNNFYEFTLNLTNTTNEKLFIGQISAQPYNINRSHLIYKFINRNKYFNINPDNGIIEYIPSKSYNKTQEHIQILVHDVIYNQNTTINVTIYINRQTLTTLIYHKTISEILPPGSLIFQTNYSLKENYQYYLKDYNINFFEINSTTSEVFLRNYLIDKFYSFKILIKPIEEIFIIKLTIIDYNNYQPNFYNLPLNLSLSLSNKFLTKISSYDYDLNTNQIVHYYLLDKNQEKIFSLNQTNGILELNNKKYLNQTNIQLYIGITDNLYLTKSYIQIHFYNYTKNLPKFSSDEYIFYYDQTRSILGQIIAYDNDLNDEISYEIYLQSKSISIDRYSGTIKVEKNFSFIKPSIEFYASAKDLAKQIVCNKK